MKMKTKQISILALLVIFVSFNALAQKAVKPAPKAKPTPKPINKISILQTATPVISDGNKAKAEEYFKKGKELWKEFEISQTIEAYTKALELYPNYPDALRERGTVYFMINENQFAVNDFNNFLKIEPDNAKILILRGKTLSEIAAKLLEIDRKKANDTAQTALADFNRAAVLTPKDVQIANGRGKLFYDFGFYKEAIADFEKGIQQLPDNHFAYTYLGYTKFLTDTGTGLSELTKAIEIMPQYSEPYYFRGNIQRNVGAYKEALKDYTKAIELLNSKAEYYNARGMLHFILKDGNAAVKDFTSAINVQKDYGMAYFNRAMTYKKFPYSVSNDDNPIAKIRLQREKMMKDFSSAIRYKPNFAQAYIERGLINSTDMRNSSVNPNVETIARYNLALADFEQAVKLDPNSAEAYNGRAICLENLGKKDLALADYTKAIQLDPDLATAYMGRMAIYCEMGKKELSIADEKKIKELGFAAINMCNLGGK